MRNEHINSLGTVIFTLSVAHTFSVKVFQQWAQKYPEGSVAENLLHMLGEVEVIFGIWAGIFFILQALFFGYSGAVHYVESQNFAEPIFVFVIMAMASTRPVLNVANQLISGVAKLAGLSPPVSLVVQRSTLPVCASKE